MEKDWDIPVMLLTRLIQNNSNATVKVFYDIACRLEDHLRAKNNTELLQKLAFAVPVFHGYGHNMDCQIKYNPRRKTGFGLTEGETVERLWSFLRNFNKVTKEMLPEHRTDLLTDGLIHYGVLMVQKFQRAVATKVKANAEYDLLLSSYPGKFNVHEAMLHDFKKLVVEPKLTKEEEHAMKLWQLESQRLKLIALEKDVHPDTKAIIDVTGTIARLDKQPHMIPWT
uniref:uncharacterized protein LOC108950923 isoform X2 n=1 Tax=Ciona intestinalis TaxID=7719 RepID=UPI000EF4AC33|nr:uncharacterized protein LOC108950923 isoform X2 [Ciona intestinalis]|eukprot:XP_026696040.1 uncharacterized protein LOC108950923 isoform X2 [Ciona intestinalis]